jgi:hypothetical protein
LDRTAVDRVLKRASELAEPRPGTLASPIGISEDMLVASAVEAGLDEDAVRVSLAIERLGPVAPVTRSDHLLGTPDVVVERLVPLDSTAALARLDQLLVRQHQLKGRRSQPGTREWQKRSGKIGAAQRAAMAVGGDAGLAKVARLQATVGEVDDEHSVVRMVADRRGQRSSRVVGSAVVGGMGIVGVGMVAVAFSPALIVATPFAVGAAYGVARKGRAQAADLATELEAVLDSVEQGATPITVTASLRRALRSPRPI